MATSSLITELLRCNHCCVHIADGDTLLFIDFRADRMRQIVEAFGIKPQFDVANTLKDLVSYLLH